MTNKKDKKNALRKMLNEKTLLEMSGGQAAPPTNWNVGTNVFIPETVSLKKTTTGYTTVGALINRVSQAETAITGLTNYSGGDTNLDTIRSLNSSNIEQKIGTTLLSPNIRSPIDTTKGLPLYIADQITKLVGNIQYKSKDDLKFLLYPTEADLNTLGKNRALTLYDLIVKDDGTFLSPDVELILNRFSAIAQFKHLPALQFIPGAQGGSRKRNKSRKLRK